MQIRGACNSGIFFMLWYLLNKYHNIKNIPELSSNTPSSEFRFNGVSNREGHLGQNTC